MPDDPKPSTPSTPESGAAPLAAKSEALPPPAADPEAVDEAREELDETRVLAESAEPATGWRNWAPLGLAALVPLAFFFVLPPLTKSGLWDPYELNVADLARRLALNLFGAGNLALDGADNSLPHLNDLGRPELPFTSIALGFKLFGLHEWAGRAPLALWGLARGAGDVRVRRALCRQARGALRGGRPRRRCPLYFVQARTMLGRHRGDGGVRDGVRRARGGGVRPGRRRARRRSSARAPWLAHGRSGSRRGVREPRRAARRRGAGGLGVAIAWGVTRLAAPADSSASDSSTRRDWLGAAVAGGCAVIGGVSLVAALRVFAEDHVADLNPWLGAMVKTPSKYPTFDYYVGHIAPLVAPWSAFLPFALGRLFIAPVGRTGNLAPPREPTRASRSLVGATVAFVAHGLLGARTDLIAFTAPALLAAACAVAIRDFERGAHASIAVGVGTLVLLGCCHHDFHELPGEGVPGVRRRQTPRSPRASRTRRSCSGRWSSSASRARVPHLGRARRQARAVRPGRAT